MEEYLVLNPPRSRSRRKRATRKRTRSPKRSTKKMARKKRKKKTRTRKRRPARKRKKTRTRKRKRRSNPRKRRRSTRSRKRKRRRNPRRRTRARTRTRRRRSRKRRTSIRRRRRNPSVRGGLKGFQSTIRSVFSAQTAIGVAQGVAGVGLALAVPKVILSWFKKGHWDKGIAGVAITAAGAALNHTLAKMVVSKSAADKILAGGLIAAGIRAALLIVPKRWTDKWLPIQLKGYARPSAPPARRVQGKGMSDYMSPRDIIEGEMAAGVGMDYDSKGYQDYLQLGRHNGRGVRDYLNVAQVADVPQVLTDVWVPGQGKERF